MAKIIKLKDKAPDIYKKWISVRALFEFPIFRIPDYISH